MVFDQILESEIFYKYIYSKYVYIVSRLDQKPPFYAIYRHFKTTFWYFKTTFWYSINHLLVLCPYVKTRKSYLENIL